MSRRRTATNTSFGVAHVEADRHRPGGVLLRVDGMESAYVHLHDPTHLQFDYIRRIGHVIDLAFPAGEPVDALHIGGGGFTLPRYVAATRPRSRSVVFEPDPAIVALARASLGLQPSRRMRVRTQDAAIGIRDQEAERFDLVVGDAFVGDEVPPQLAEAAFADHVRRVLRPDGVYAMNIIDRPPFAFARGQAAMLTERYGSGVAIAPRAVLDGRRQGNIVLAASTRELASPALERRVHGDPLPAEAVALDAFALAAGRHVRGATGLDALLER